MVNKMFDDIKSDLDKYNEISSSQDKLKKTIFEKVQKKVEASLHDNLNKDKWLKKEDTSIENFDEFKNISIDKIEELKEIIPFFVFDFYFEKACEACENDYNPNNLKEFNTFLIDTKEEYIRLFALNQKTGEKVLLVDESNYVAYKYEEDLIYRPFPPIRSFVVNNDITFSI